MACREYNKEYYAKNKEILSQKRKVKYYNNLEKEKQKKKEWRSKPEIKIKELEYAKKYREENPEKVKKSHKNWKKENPKYFKEYKTYNKEKIRWYAIKKKYGLTKEQWEQIYKDQDGKCFICHRTYQQIKKSKSKYLVVDHCHKTGKIRALLCTYCNRSLAQFFKEDPEVVMRAYIHLTREVNYGTANTDFHEKRNIKCLTLTRENEKDEGK